MDTISLERMTAEQRAVFLAHCERTHEEPARKVARLNAILEGGKRKRAS